MRRLRSIKKDVFGNICVSLHLRNTLAMLIKLYNGSIGEKQLDLTVKTLQDGGICIVPTDTLYAIVCDIDNHKAAKNLAELKGKKLEKSNFSILCNSLSMASLYIKPLTDRQFAFIKGLQSGGFTFILQAGKLTPKIFQNKRKTIGIRIDQNPAVCSIIDRLGRPLLVTSVARDGEREEIYQNAELIYEYYEDKADIVLDAGPTADVPSTVVDLTDAEEYRIIRQGLGVIDN